MMKTCNVFQKDFESAANHIEFLRHVLMALIKY